jgi:Ran GTPase-activating protein (RanGAP) involved in mRNA processing and transport
MKMHLQQLMRMIEMQHSTDPIDVAIAHTISVPAHTALEVFALPGDGITDSEVEHFLFCVLDGNFEIARLSLRHNRLTSASLEAIGNMLHKLPYLVELDLSGNTFLGRGMRISRRIPRLSVRKHCAIQTLCLDRCQLTDDTLAELFTGFTGNRELTSVSINGNETHMRTAMALSGCMQHPGSRLRILHAANNKFDAECAQHIARAIHAHKHLQALNVHGNPLTSEGVVALCTALLDCDSITMLNIGGTGITKSGGNAVSKLVAHTGSLSELFVSHNELGNEGVSRIARALEANFSLRTLELAYNHFGEGVSVSLATGLSVNRGLYSLSVEGNALSDATVTALCGALRKQGTLLSLNISRCSLSDKSMLKICSVSLLMRLSL